MPISTPQTIANEYNLTILLLLCRFTAQSRATDFHEHPWALAAAERERCLRRSAEAHPNPSSRQEAQQEWDPPPGHEVHQLPGQAPQRPGWHGGWRSPRCSCHPRRDPSSGRPPSGDAEPELQLRESAGRRRQSGELYRRPGLFSGVQVFGEGTASLQPPARRERPAMTDLALTDWEGVMLHGTQLAYVHVVCKHILTYDFLLSSSLRASTLRCPPRWNAGTGENVR